MFSCAFVGSRYIRDGLLLRSGIIVFNGNAEVFDSPIAVWTEDDYEESWIKAIGCITAPQPINSAIVTGFNGIQAAYLHWWPLYPVGKMVAIHEQFLMLDKIRNGITEDNLFDFVPAKACHHPDGELSEWIESSEAFSMFGHCLKIARDSK